MTVFVIYTIVVAYMVVNFVVLWINDVWSRKHNKLSVSAALDELVEEHLKMNPHCTKVHEMLTRWWAVLIGLLFTVPVLVKMRVQHYRNINVRY